MKITVTGYKGEVGQRLINLGYEPLECDVTNEVVVSKAIAKSRPDIIVHLAGKSDVDFCEDKKNQEAVIQSNFRGSGIVFKQAYAYNAKVVYISSDHIFSGRWFGSYLENSKPNPKNYYGTLKLASEAMSKVYPNVHIVRTSTLFWGNRWIVQNPLLALVREEKVYAPNFILRSFMHIDHFVEQLNNYCLNINDNPPKVLHLSGSKTVSWYKFLVNYAKALKLDYTLIKPRYWEFSDDVIKAPRPHRAGLDTDLSRRLGYRQYSYIDGIKHAIQL